MPQEETKRCPYCYEEINTHAIKCKHCGSMLETPPSGPPGSPLTAPDPQAGATGTLSGRYQIIRELGRGGMGVVYLARDKELDMDVAVKFLPVELSKDQYALDLLRSEAKLSMSLSHPNILRLHTLDTSGQFKFLVMEYVEGKDLLSIIRERGKLGFEEALPIIKAVCDGLDYAHSMRILHRDLKPANIMVTNVGETKIADFGIARQMRESMTRLSQKTVSGTPAYMAPEHIMGEHLTVRSDIYSLGAVAYEILTGMPPFYQGDILAQIRYKMPPRMPGVPESANKAVLAALAKDASYRPASGADFYKMLTTGQAVATQPDTPRPAPPPVEPPEPEPARKRPVIRPDPAPRVPDTLRAPEPDKKAATPDAGKAVWGKIGAKSAMRPRTSIRAASEKKPGVIIAAGVVCALVVLAVIVLAVFGKALGIFPGEEKPVKPAEILGRPEMPISWGDGRGEKKGRQPKAGDRPTPPHRETEAERKAREEREHKKREREAKRKKDEEFRQWLEAAKAYLAKEQYREAIRSVQSALKLKPDDAEAKKVLEQAKVVILVPGDCKTIQEAIDRAEKGQIVIVGNGVYRGEGNRDIEFKGKAITLRSEKGPENCIIDCQESGRGFYFARYETEKSVLQGFTIKNGKVTGDGGGICCRSSSSPKIIGCKIVDCSAANGGGISCWSRSNPALVNCIIAENSASAKGGGINCWNNCSPEIINCTIAHNKSKKCGGGVAASERSRPELKNSIVWENRVTEASAETTGRKPARTGPEFDESYIRGHDLYTYDSSSIIKTNNCCFARNTRERNAWSGEGRIEYNYYVSEDPEFEGGYGAKYKLGKGSPCIDKGNDEHIPEGITTDFAGRPRIADGDDRWGTKVDIGAYERQ